MASLGKGRPGAKLATLSIDDGLRNVVTRAYPLMRKYGARGTFYVVPDLVGKGEMLWTDFVETVVRNAPVGDFLFRYRETDIRYTLDDEASRRRAMKAIKRLLRSLPDSKRKEHMAQFRSIELADVPEDFALADWEELRGLDPSVLALGNHTATHPNCARLETEAELEREISQAGLDIAEKVGYPVRHFCYPAGSYNESVLAKLREQGYHSGVTTLAGFGSPTDDPLLLRRVEAEDEWYLFLATTSGAYPFFTQLKSRLKALAGERRPFPAPKPVAAAGDLPGGG
jgi:peptidoglycan/xylan/chitin deacetylase (PgdA/CDA1 family)